MVEGALDEYGFCALEESEWINEIQNPLSTFSDNSFALIYKHTCGVWALGGKSLLATAVFILHLTGDHKIPEIRELVDDNDRHLHT